MNIQLRLLLFRSYHKWTFHDIAERLNLLDEFYKDIEEGKLTVNNILAQKLSDLYQAPLELFLADETKHYQHAEVLYNNCTFIGGQGGSSGYINHQYNDRGIDEILFAKNEEIKNLRQQIELLQKQNIDLANGVNNNQV